MYGTVWHSTARCDTKRLIAARHLDHLGVVIPSNLKSRGIARRHLLGRCSFGKAAEVIPGSADQWVIVLATARSDRRCGVGHGANMVRV